MKRSILAVLAILTVSTAVYAATLASDDQNNIIQTPAYHGGKAQALTIYGLGTKSNTVDMRNDAHYSVYCAGAASERWMYGNYTAGTAAGIAARAAYVKTTIPATTWHGGAVNKSTPYANFSGCSGFLRRQ